MPAAGDTPLVGVQLPARLGRVKQAHVADVLCQLKELAKVLEGVAGRRLNPARLERAVGLSRRCTDLWQRVLELSARRPAPLTFFDHCIHMAPAVVLRGAPEGGGVLSSASG